MMTRNLERMLAEYIANGYGAEGYTVSTSDGSRFDIAFTGPLDGQSIRILAGETISEQTLPKIVVSAEEGEEDFDTGNHMIDLRVSVSYPVDPTDSVADQFERLETETERLRDFLIDDDLPSLITAGITSSFDVTVIGVAGRSSGSDYSGHMRTHEINLRLYVAGLELA